TARLPDWSEATGARPDLARRAGPPHTGRWPHWPDRSAAKDAANLAWRAGTVRRGRGRASGDHSLIVVNPHLPGHQPGQQVVAGFGEGVVLPDAGDDTVDHRLNDLGELSPDVLWGRRQLETSHD